MTVWVADFESYYDDEYQLKKLTTSEYILDSRFETIGLGLINWATKERYWLRPDEIAYFLKHLGPVPMCAHHAHFDGLILSHHYGYRPTFWFDTLSMANALEPKHQKKGVKDLAGKYGIGEKGIEVELAKGKHYSDFSDSEWHRYGQYCLNDADLEGKLLEIYLGKYAPGAIELELDLIDITIRCFTEPSLVLDEQMLKDYAVREAARKQALFDRCGLDRKVFSSNPQFAALLREWGVEPAMKPTTRKDKATGERVASETFAFAKTDPFMQNLLESEQDELRWFAEARIASKSTQALTRTQRFIKIGEAGRRVPVYYKYSPAHTYRWGGGDRMNWQNLGRVNKKKPDSGILRLAVRAADGEAMVVGDSSQIEPRMASVLANEEWLVEAFEQGRDTYSEFASEVYGRMVDRKKNPDDVLPGFVGKVSIISMGYGVGFIKAAQTFLAGALGGEPVQFTERDIEAMQIDYNGFVYDQSLVRRTFETPSRLPRNEWLIHCIVSHAIVERYRAKNARIKGLWKHLGEAIRWMHEGEEVVLDTPIYLKTVRHGLELPNGMVLDYPGLEYDGKQYTYLGGISGRERTKIYGGLFLENIDQCLSRFVVAEQMRRYAREYRRKVALTTHDEIGAVVRHEEGAQAAIELEQCMKTRPSWAPMLPVACEVHWGVCYGEIK